MIRRIQSSRIVLLASCFIFASTCSTAFALPPLGLTQISSQNLNSGLEVIDGAAYLNVSSGIWTVNSLGSTSFVPVASPTPVVKANDGELYFVSNQTGPSLRRFDQPGVAITSWDGGRAVGVDSQLRVLGNIEGDFGENLAVKFLPGGCVADVCTEFLTGDVGSPSLLAVTPQGYAFGDGGIPGTIGSSPALWGPDDQFINFAFGYDIPGTIRDRKDSVDVNMSTAGGELIFGISSNMGSNYIWPNYSVLPSGWLDAHVVVSHGNFVVAVENTYNNTPPEVYGFYPGIYDDFSYDPVPLTDLFPELATIDIDSIGAASSVGGNIYLTINGSDGLYLFGARDPSLIPEPTTAVLPLIGLPVILRRKR